MGAAADADAKTHHSAGGVIKGVFPLREGLQAVYAPMRTGAPAGGRAVSRAGVRDRQGGGGYALIMLPVHPESDGRVHDQSAALFSSENEEK